MDGAWTHRRPSAPGEQLDWITLERYLRAHLPSARRAVRGAAVPERVGQPHVPAAVRRDRARAAPPALRGRRPRCPRHEAGVPRALQALDVVRPGAARAPVLRRPRASSAPTSWSWTAGTARSCATRSRRRWPTIPMSPAASGWPWSTRWPTCTSSTPMRPASAISVAPTGSPSGRSPGGRRGGASCDPTTVRPSWTSWPTGSPPRCRRRRAPRSCTTTSSWTTASSTRPTPTASVRSSTGT